MVIQSALIVDDSKLARVTLRKKLIRHGVEADLAESAEEAIVKIQTDRPDIIFMDHLMPGIDGFEATRIIRQMQGMADLPIIMCTGKDHEGYLEEAKANGANSILGKPATEETLAAILAIDFTSQFAQQDGRSNETATKAAPAYEQLTASQFDSGLTDDIEPLVFDADQLTVTTDQGEVSAIDNGVHYHQTVSGIASNEHEKAVMTSGETLDDLLVDDNAIDTGSLPRATVTDDQRLMDVVEQKIIACKEVLSDELLASLSAVITRQLASQSAPLLAEDINARVDVRMQTLWKKNALAVNEKLTELKQQIDRVEALPQNQQRDQQSDQSYNQPCNQPCDQQRALTTDRSGNDDDQWMAQKIRDLENQLARTSKAASIAKQIGFAAFVTATSAVAYFIAKLFHFV